MRLFFKDKQTFKGLRKHLMSFIKKNGAPRNASDKLVYHSRIRRLGVDGGQHLIRSDEDGVEAGDEESAGSLPGEAQLVSGAKNEDAALLNGGELLELTRPLQARQIRVSDHNAAMPYPACSSNTL